jgi:DnaJ family protein C protein 8
MSSVVQEKAEEAEETAETVANDGLLNDSTAPPAAVADWKIQRDDAKMRGDQAFQDRNYKIAIAEYTAALSLDPSFAVALSNRSAAYLKANEKSKALRDANDCVALNTFGYKAHSRLAAALQSLGRYKQAKQEWNVVLQHDANNTAAKKGVEDCDCVLTREETTMETDQHAAAASKTTTTSDDLDDFFNDVDQAAHQIQKERELAALPVATQAINKHKTALGTADDQIARLVLQDNYTWKNLNPFHVLDLSHEATSQDISRRYKALCLLLHPDKQQQQSQSSKASTIITMANTQEAYDYVLQAKATLDDENKARHCRQLVETGMQQGESEWRQNHTTTTLEQAQQTAVAKIFAHIEYQRRQVEKNERAFEQRQQEAESSEQTKLRADRTFDAQWKVKERVEKRIGNWRDFSSNKKANL